MTTRKEMIIQDNRPPICHITTVHPPFDDRIFHKECKTLSKAGYNVTLIARHDVNEIVGGVTLIPLLKAKNRLHRFLIMTSNAFCAAIRLHADVYHFHDPELLPVGVLLKLLTGKKIIYDVHEDYETKILSKEWIRKEFRKPVSVIYGFLEKIASNFFDYIITADSYMAMKFETHKTQVIGNYPPVKFADEEKRCNNKLFKVIYVGTVSEDRGIHIMLDSMKYLQKKNIELHILGEVAKNKIRDIGKSSAKVIYHGFVPWEDVGKFLGEADIGLLMLQPTPSYLNLTGESVIKLFEYMSFRLPVIISDFPQLKTMIDEIGCGIAVDPTDSRTIARTIEYLYLNPDVRKQMGENGRRAILEKYNWERESSKLFMVYREVLTKVKHKDSIGTSNEGR